MGLKKGGLAVALGVANLNTMAGQNARLCTAIAQTDPVQ